MTHQKSHIWSWWARFSQNGPADLPSVYRVAISQTSDFHGAVGRIRDLARPSAYNSIKLPVLKSSK